MIIGITGTDGAGKGAVVEYLVNEKGYQHYSSRVLITEEIERRGLPVNRDTMRLAANDLRREHGNDYIITTAINRVQSENILNAVIESLRASAEVEALKVGGGILLTVDADQKLRYERIQERKSASDQISFEEFCEHEALEMNDPYPNGMQKAKVMQMTDYTIENNGTIEELHQQIEEILKQIEDANNS